MGKELSVMLLLAAFGAGGFAQKTPTSPADESRTPAPVRSPYSMGKDLLVPLCPAHFHDSLRGNGIAGPHDQDVTPATVKKPVPAEITLQAIDSSGKTHIGNYVVIVNVLVNTKGIPSGLCLEKSSGYGLDGAAASAVSQYRFNPAQKNGKPIRMRVPVEVRFKNPEIAMAGSGFFRPDGEMVGARFR